MAASRKRPTPAARGYWLVKTEPEVFSFDDLWSAEGRSTVWDGVRNYQARNYLRDGMRRGDQVLIYHSSREAPAVVGIAEVVRAGYPDPSQFDPQHERFDPKAKPQAPAWVAVDLRAVRRLARPVTLAEIKAHKALGDMVLVQRGSRLSVQPVREPEWRAILALGG